MIFSKPYTVIVNEDSFNKFLFNRYHFFGSLKLHAFLKNNFSYIDIDSIISQIKQFPHKYSAEIIETIYKTELISKISINGPLKIDNSTIVLVNTFWIYKYTSEKFELLTLCKIK